MSSLCFATIESTALEVPHGSVSSEDIETYVDRLRSCSDLMGEPAVQLLLSDESIPALLDVDHFPTQSALKIVLSHSNIDWIDAHTLNGLVQRVISRAASFEETFQLKEVLLEQFKSNPEIIEQFKPSPLTSGLERVVTLSALLEHYSEVPINHALIMSGADNIELEIQAKIADIEHMRGDLPNLQDLSEFSGKVHTCSDMHSYLQTVDEVQLFIRASDNDELAFAIRVHLLKRASELSPSVEWNEIRVPIIGHEFLNRCKSICAANSKSVPMKILRAIGSLVFKVNSASTHALRTSACGGSPQRMRGEDKAQRKDVDREFHLHYWELKNSEVELASVNYHNDFTIPE